MSQSYRKNDGGRIDRSKPIRFSFNGKTYKGFEGDTLASALLANGVRVVSRSFKFHRRRGILSAGVEETGGILGADYGCGMLPVVRATQIPLREGLRAESQNCFPSLKFDCLRIFDFTRSLWPAGFYNKIFKWPNWHSFEWAIRASAGLGKLPETISPARYCHMNAHCDVLVVGSGYAGLSAALRAARAGDHVIVVEQEVEAGGSMLHDPEEVEGRLPADWLSDALQELRTFESVQIMLYSTVSGYYDSNVLTVHDRSAAYRRHDSVELFWKIRAARVVLASGAIEQPLMFGNNDLPGIMLAGAMRHYANRFAVQCGRRVVGIVNNDLAWHSLIELPDAGVTIAAVIDTRAEPAERILELARRANIEVHSGAAPIRAIGSGAVKAIEFRDARGVRQSIRCDAVAMSGGLNPTVHLYSQAGGNLRYDEQLACFVPHRCRQAVEVVGAAAADFATPDAYNISQRKASSAQSSSQWVDFLHDVTVSDIELACRENLQSIEHVKRYTTTGMSIDQGKTSNLNALTLVGEITKRTPADVGTTTFRPMFMPVTMGAIGGVRRGDFYMPAKRLPVHEWHAERGAIFEDYGGWDRPAWYGGQREESIRREALLVRQSVGLFDGSPLGKIEVKGPDAAEFLSRVYVNTVHTLKPGKVRYGLMLNENGVVIDDGVFVRLAEDHFLINTTSANADRIVGWLEEWHQCEWPNLDLVMTPVTSQWAVATVAGPAANAVLQAIPGIPDLSSATFPHMSFAAGDLADGTPFRIQRVSFTGEQSFELNVPSQCATDIFASLWHEGKAYGMGMFGAECLMVLRLEKGFLHVGGDTDGSTNPFDIGFGGIVENKRGDFIGARSLQRAEDRRSDRRQLVGFEIDDPGSTVVPGAHIISGVGESRRSEGFVTSACLSPALGKTVGLGLLERGFERDGESVQLFDEGRVVTAKIARNCFFDPQGERMRA